MTLRMSQLVSLITKMSCNVIRDIGIGALESISWYRSFSSIFISPKSADTIDTDIDTSFQSIIYTSTHKNTHTHICMCYVYIHMYKICMRVLASTYVNSFLTSSLFYEYLFSVSKHSIESLIVTLAAVMRCHSWSYSLPALRVPPSPSLSPRNSASFIVKTGVTL